jgi:serine/threonine protein kinase
LDENEIDLLSKMLKFNRKERINTLDALNHPYFKSVFNKEDIINDIDQFDIQKFEKIAINNGIKKTMYNTLVDIHSKKNKKRERDGKKEDKMDEEEVDIVNSCESPINDIISIFLKDSPKYKKSKYF